MAARAGRIVTFGMRPTGPETGYGYIERRRPAARRRPACTPSPASSKSRMPPPPRAWSPTAGICGTPACSCSPPRTLLAGAGARMRRTCCRRCAQAVAARRADLDFIRLDAAAFTACAVDQPRLRGRRAHRPRRGGAGRYRLVRRGQLERAVGPGRARTPPATSRSATWCWRMRHELLRAQRRHADRGGRAERRGGGGDRGRGAGDASRPGAGREEGGGPAEGGRPARGGGA